MKNNIFRGLLVAFIAFALPFNIAAVELITNGGFESATSFQGWSVVNSPSPWRLLSNSGPGSGGGFTSVAVTSVAPGGGLTKNVWCGQTDNITSNSQWQFFQSFTIPTGNAITVSWKDRYQMNHTDFCPAGTCQPTRYFVELTNGTGTTVIQTLNTISTVGNINQDTGWVSRSVSVPGLGGQTVRLRFRGTETVPLTGPGQVEIDLVSVNAFAPTAATSAISGRAVDSFGNALSRVFITVTDSAGASRTITTNTFGFYKIDGLNSGETYIVSATGKGLLFPDSPRAVNVTENVVSLDFIASPSLSRFGVIRD